MTIEISTGEYLTRLLEAYGVEVVFGIPGVHTVELYRGLAGSGIRHVTPRHEQGAGFMADGYARVTGRPGVCFIISGPGMTNIVTAMGQAYGDSVPMLVISTVNAHGRMGSGEGWLHELPNQQALVSGVAAFSRTVHRPEELALAIAQAFAVFEGARPRPVHIELPIDVMLAGAGHLPPPARAPELFRPGPDAAGLASAAAMLEGAKRPLLLCGGGAVRGASAIRRLAETLDAPVLMTTNGRGILPPDHPLAVSLSPSLEAARALVREADVVLALGTEFGRTDYDFNEDGGFDLPGRLIRVDIDPAQCRRGPAAAAAIVSDAGAAATALAADLRPRQRGGAGRAAAAMAGLAELTAPYRADLKMLALVRDTLPGLVLVGDSTQAAYAANCAYAAPLPGGFFGASTGFGTLGYALPAAVGAAIGAPDRPVVAVMGDGGLQFTLAELASAAEARVPLILLVYDNQGYGEIKSYMARRNIPPIGVDILTPDLMAIARASGWRVQHIDRVEELVPALTAAGAGQGPVMLHYDDRLRAAFGASG